MTAALTRPALGTRSSSDPRAPLRRSTSRSRIGCRLRADASSSMSSSSSSPASKSSNQSSSQSMPSPPPSGSWDSSPSASCVDVGLDQRVEKELGAGPAVHPAGGTRLREGLGGAVGPGPRPDAELDLAARGRASRPSRPSATGRCRPSTPCVAAPAEDTGSGADSTTVTPAPPFASGRRTAIRGGSVPAIRRAFTLAATRTPSSGACTTASRSANCVNPMLAPAAQFAHAKPSGVAGGVG